MPSQSRWYITAVVALQEALDALPPGSDFAAARKACRESYPFGERRMHPYKQWCKAQREILAKRYPREFQARLGRTEQADRAAGQMLLPEATP